MPRQNNAVPAYEIMKQWICCVCRWNNNPFIHAQCLNPQCQHARCKDFCTVEKCRVRVEQQPGSTSSRRC